jgi:broad specificity phosphatase PhoE
MLTLILTRHGETDKSHPEQYLGQRMRASLTATGRAAAVALGDRLADVELARVISSPLARARETAGLIRPGDAIQTDERLMEADYGAWEGHTVEEIEAGWPEERRRYEVDPARWGPPDGESGEDVARRAAEFLDELVAWADGSGSRGGSPARDPHVLVVGHATVNRVLLAVCLDVPLRDYRRRFVQDWANLTVLRFPGSRDAGGQLLLGNDVSHLRGVRGATWD